MLVFIDESGDPGLKIEKGSSKFFTVSLVIFEDKDEALACDQRITLLKRELGWKEDSEFHFKRNSDNVRRAFLKAVAPYNFFYYGIVINKDPKKLWGEGFRNKSSFYKYACSLVFQNAKDKLENSTVVIDKSGNLDFRRQLAKYLRRKLNEEGKKLIKKVKMQRSRGNNLLQLADYIAGVINRSVQSRKKFAIEYRRIIAHREIYIQTWPK
ncbi:MAG: hypothetical protein COX44_01490 [Candidatus Portnoybacteria bacterium CG23_combo_of_CG06-09_8_20_14_all_37_13]|uniref:DUF3800 domain-containing protein n=1 Tax=Candidatus Portnoybacteria bacterium CG23_combo_of_CG06-09_8_20_14_all_37_13 TaxID=1974819 RepID=A0A2G9YD25_9BACT|nr:MAG: hypothetical protein COX44_01490 [Candidatus Portnoybacteria bacterium CG23_combo_of_CG06-09_8_20_14_all_37_13]